MGVESFCEPEWTIEERASEFESFIDQRIKDVKGLNTCEDCGGLNLHYFFDDSLTVEEWYDNPTFCCIDCEEFKPIP